MIEADFQREYCLDLMAELRAGLTLRRFGVLVRGLARFSPPATQA